MSGPELVLVRHGRTAWNARKVFMGRTDMPLDEVGHAQALALAQSPRVAGIAAVYTSPLKRAHQTAAYVRPAPTPVGGLEELDQGELEGLSVPEAVARHEAFFQAWMRDPVGVCVPGGESLDAGRDRIWAALEQVARHHEADERVVVVSHQLVLAAFVATVAGEPLSSWRRFGLEHTGSHRIRWAPAGPLLLPDAP